MEYHSCKTEQQLKDYYVRLGVQLFLAYVLGTKDLHCENIIASGEYPVLIDLEVLLSTMELKEGKTAPQEIINQLSKSVLQTGIDVYKRQAVSLWEYRLSYLQARSMPHSCRDIMTKPGIVQRKRSCFRSSQRY